MADLALIRHLVHSGHWSTARAEASGDALALDYVRTHAARPLARLSAQPGRALIVWAHNANPSCCDEAGDGYGYDDLFGFLAYGDKHGGGGGAGYRYDSDDGDGDGEPEYREGYDPRGCHMEHDGDGIGEGYAHGGGCGYGYGDSGGPNGNGNGTGNADEAD